MELRWHAVLESRAELSGSVFLWPLASKTPRLSPGVGNQPRLVGGRQCCCSTVKMRVVVCSLMRDVKHSVNIIVSGVEVGVLDSVRQIVHLVLATVSIAVSAHF